MMESAAYRLTPDLLIEKASGTQPIPMKVCTACKNERTVEEFHPSKTEGVRQNVCRSCFSARSKERWAKARSQGHTRWDGLTVTPKSTPEVTPTPASPGVKEAVHLLSDTLFGVEPDPIRTLSETMEASIRRMVEERTKDGRKAAREALEMARWALGEAQTAITQALDAIGEE